MVNCLPRNGYLGQAQMRIVRGQLDMSGNLTGVQHVYSISDVIEFWCYGRYVYFLDMDMPVVLTRKDVLDELYSRDPRNPEPLGRSNDTNYRRRPGENITAPSDTLPFVEALQSGEVSSRPSPPESNRGRGFGRG